MRKTLFYARELCRYIEGMKSYLVISIACNFLFKLMPILISGVTSYLISSVVLGVTDRVMTLFYIIISLIIGAGLSSYLDIMVSHDMAYRILAKLRNACYKKIEEIAPAGLEGKHSADLTNIVLEDVEQLEWFYAHTIEQLFVAIILPALSFIVLGIIDPIISIVIIPFIIILVGIAVHNSKISNEQGKKVKEAYGKVNSQIVDGIQGLKDILSFFYKPFFLNKYENVLLEHQNRQIDYAINSGCKVRSYGLIIGLASLSGDLAACYSVIKGRMDSIWLLTVFALSMAIFSPIQEALTMSVNYGLIVGAAKRVTELLSTKSVVTEDSNSIDFKERSDVTLSLKGIKFSYPEMEKTLLKNVSLEIKPGECIALTGKSGCGKTTIAKLIQRFWDIEDGKITLNGVDIRKMKLEDLRQTITMVPQDTYLFYMSIADNLRMAKEDATDEEIIKALEQACAMDFVDKLPQGINTIVGERGLRLSGGEKQRISLARAFLKNSPILILDESSAALDTETERKINMAIDRLKEHRTTLVIAHRESTIKATDRAFQIQNGCCVEV